MKQPGDRTAVAHEMVIRETLQSAAVRARNEHGWEPVERRTPLHELIAREEDGVSEEWQIKREAFHELLEFVFQSGPHPLLVMQHVYALAKALRPDLLLHMSLADLGRIFSDTKAAWSWRIKQVISKRIGMAGQNGARMRGTRLSFQKSATAVERYREAQRGNTNRRSKAEGRKSKAGGAAGKPKRGESKADGER